MDGLGKNLAGVWGPMDSKLLDLMRGQDLEEARGRVGGQRGQGPDA